MKNTVHEESADSKKLGYGPVSALFVTITAYTGSQVFVGIWVALVTAILGWGELRTESWLQTSVFAQFLTVLALEAAFLYIIWLFLQFMRVKLSKIGLVKPVVRDIGYALAGYAVYFAVFVVITSIAQQLLPVLDMEQEQELGFSKETTGPALGLIFISLVILPPITEEIVTRGFLYTGLRSKLPKVVAAIFTSLLFAAAHLQWGNDTPLLWVAAIDTFLLSLILVYLREKTGSLWPPIMVHMLKNGLAFMVLFIFKVA
jgi:uncharacterized protein